MKVKLARKTRYKYLIQDYDDPLVKKFMKRWMKFFHKMSTSDSTPNARRIAFDFFARGYFCAIKNKTM